MLSIREDVVKSVVLHLVGSVVRALDQLLARNRANHCAPFGAVRPSLASE